MYVFRVFLSTLLVSLTAAPALADDASNSAKAVFNELASLAGIWQSQRKGSETTIEMKLIANNSTLIENWTMSPTKQSMTVYTLDGERLLATHYCPQGNAPRLAYTHTDAAGAYHFAFVDGTNLQPPTAYHEHAFSLQIDSAGQITRNEIYIRNDEKFDPQKHQGKSETFARVQAIN